jgi:threonine synthase
MQLLAQKAARPDGKLQISAYAYSPAGMAGVQTISYELAEQARALDGGRWIDHVFVQAGGGGLTLAVARGFDGLVQRGELEKMPAVHCVQPHGNNTIAGPLRDGADKGQDLAQCTSKVSGLQVARVIDGNEVIPACRDSGGNGYLVSDEETWQLQARLAREEGIFAEPAGAVALAGALQSRQRGEIDGDDVVVCLVTGFGFKDAASIDRMIADVDCPTIDAEEIAAR